MDSNGYNKIITDVNDINKDGAYFQREDVKIRASSFDECRNTRRKQQRQQQQQQETKHNSQGYRFDTEVKEYGIDQQDTIKEDQQLDDDDRKYFDLSLTNKLGKGQQKIPSSDDISKDQKYSSLHPTDNVGKELLSRHNYESKQKRNTILFPASYHVQREEISNRSRSLPSLIDSVGPQTSKKDITSSPLYKEIYINNIRQYSFLLAKRLGTSNQSPQELRKLYQQNRQKAAARGTNASSIQQKQASSAIKSSESSLKVGNDDRCKDGIDSLSSTSRFHSEPTLTGRKFNSCKGKHKGSLTDISNILCQIDHKALITEPSNTADGKEFESTGIPAGDVNSNPTIDTEYDDEAFSDSTESVELDHRQDEADRRRRGRVARLKSFDNMVKNANTFMKDLKLRRKFSKSMDT